MAPEDAPHFAPNRLLRSEPQAPLVAGLFERLDRTIATLWARARAGAFFRHVLEQGVDRELLRQTLSQIVHYTRHNSINQAVAALRASPDDALLLRFVYLHAAEELGHEKLALRDLEALGISREALAPPLPATDALIHYLYGVALREGAVARLGYSYWAESAYREIEPLLARVRESLGLDDRALTFFVAHSAIDVRHAEQVRQTLRTQVSTPEQARAVERVAATSLWLTIEVLEQALEARLHGEVRR
jgi:pyrroloquinoline quinone (PQQ) biosynthesis protein C